MIDISDVDDIMRNLRVRPSAAAKSAARRRMLAHMAQHKSVLRLTFDELDFAAAGINGSPCPARGCPGFIQAGAGRCHVCGTMEKT